MPKEVNEYILRFTGNVAISHELKRQYDYKFLVTATVNRAEISDNEDGTLSVIYKAKMIMAETQGEGEKIQTVAKKGWSTSQKLRWEIQRENDSEEYYQKIMTAIRANLDEIIQKYAT